MFACRSQTLCRVQLAVHFNSGGEMVVVVDGLLVERRKVKSESGFFFLFSLWPLCSGPEGWKDARRSVLPS